MYTKYIQRNYKGNVTIVDIQVDIHEMNTVPFTQDRFLSNTENKANFINFLSRYLLQVGYSTINCPGNADSTIVKTALEIADSKQVIVVADDTDVVLMLVHHWQNHMSDVYFLARTMGQGLEYQECQFQMRKYQRTLAFYPCMIKGKAKLVEALTKEEWSNQTEVGKASIKAFTLLYGGKDGNTLVKLR